MTQPNLPAPGAEMIARSSPVSRPSPPGGLRPALTPAAGSTGLHRSGADQKEDQQIKIRLTEVSTVRGDCRASVLAGLDHWLERYGSFAVREGRPQS
jgi:hypothetical protein